MSKENDRFPHGAASPPPPRKPGAGITGKREGLPHRKPSLLFEPGLTARIQGLFSAQ